MAIAFAGRGVLFAGWAPPGSAKPKAIQLPDGRTGANLPETRCCSLALDRSVVIQVRLMGRTIIVVSSILIMGTADGLAQSSEPDRTIQALQTQLQEMRSQMATMQNRIATLEAAKGILETPPPQAVRPQPDETKTAGEQTAFSFKGLTLTPGGFLTINSSGAQPE